MRVVWLRLIYHLRLYHTHRRALGPGAALARALSVALAPDPSMAVRACGVLRCLVIARYVGRHLCAHTTVELQFEVQRLYAEGSRPPTGLRYSPLPPERGPGVISAFDARRAAA